MGSQMQLFWKNLKETHAFHTLTVQRWSARNGAPTTVRAVFQAASQFLKQLSEDRQELFYQTSGWSNHRS